MANILKKSPEYSACTLVHPSGVHFTVNLTKYESNRVNCDEEFATELIEKYYKLYKKKLVYPDTASTSQNDMDNIDEQGGCQERGDELRRDYVPEDHEEMLISLVAQRPALFNMKLPLIQRCGAVSNALWEEIRTELQLTNSIKDLSNKWKNIRDSYLRARANIRRKIASGSSATEKLQAEKIKQNHKHYDLLQFLDDTLSIRKTTSNIPSPDPETGSSETTLTDAAPTSSKKRKSEACLSSADEIFFSKMDALSARSTVQQPPYTSAQHFCMRLADSLEKLPRTVRNRLEVEILQKVTEAEERYIAMDTYSHD